MAPGRSRQLGRGMRSVRRARRVRKGVALPRLDQTDHQQLLVARDTAFPIDVKRLEKKKKINCFKYLYYDYVRYNVIISAIDDFERILL